MLLDLALLHFLVSVSVVCGEKEIPEDLVKKVVQDILSTQDAATASSSSDTPPVNPEVETEARSKRSDSSDGNFQKDDPATLAGYDRTTPL